MTAPNPIALMAAVLMTAVVLTALSPTAHVAPPSQTNGVRIVDLAPITVRPSADDLRAAALPPPSGRSQLARSVATTLPHGVRVYPAQLVPSVTVGTPQMVELGKE